MKKRIVILFALLSILLSSCSTDRFSDVKKFERQFNKQCNNYAINIDSALISEYEGQTIYSFVIKKDNINFLISLYTDIGSAKITGCSVTANADISKMNQQGLTVFKELCSAVIISYSSGSDSSEDIASALHIPKVGEYSNTVVQRTQTLQNRYTYSADGYGAYFSVENKELCSESSAALTLRNETDISG